MSKIRVGIVGGTGYTGAELLRLLAGHPEVEIDCVTSRSQAGTAVADHFPSLRGLVSAQYTEPDVHRLADCTLVYFATPNGTAMHSVPALLEAGVRIIDLAADFRLADAGLWARWYGVEHACPELLDDAVYGLPEINRMAIRDARLVANPGCYPTAVQLGFLPLLENRLIESSGLIADVKSGVSGAGRTQAMHAQFCEVSDSFKAYAVSGHRHLPEIEQGLSRISGGSVGLTFVPHLVPMIRGIHATLYARLVAADADIQTAFEQRYAREPFVDVLEPGAFPDTGHVRGSNVCQISWHRPQDGDTVVVLVAVDNLVKGAAGQAVQNMNIMFSLDECTALGGAGLSP